MWEQLLSALGGNLLGGVKDLVQTFKLPPEQQLAFEQAMAKAQADLQISLEKIAADDRNSARQREIAVKDQTPPRLAFFLTAGFFGLLGYMVMYPLPQGSERVIDMMLGSLGTAWLSSIYYYFGTSAGSDKKHDLIDKMVSSGK